MNDYYAKELDASHLESYWDPTWNVKEFRKVFSFPGPEEWHPGSGGGCKVVDYLWSYNDNNAPLFCWVSCSGPHYPFDPPQPHFNWVNVSKDKTRAYLKAFADFAYPIYE